MSRVCTALKLAENWEGKSVFTGHPEPVSPAPRTFDPAISIELRAPSRQKWDADPVGRPYWTSRWLQRWRGRVVGTATLVPRCISTTRRGQPCRGPAMGNGYCRMHGDARRFQLGERILDAHETLTAKTDNNRPGISRAVAGIARFLTSRLRSAA